MFVHSGTDCHEHQFVSNRWTFRETPAIELGGRIALELAGLDIDDIDIVDLYSCFPSAVQLGAQSLGLALDRQLTRTGGLPFAGGPWNNYVMHAIATVMNDLREPTRRARAWCGRNGGYTTKHAFGVYSTDAARRTASSHAYPQDEIDAMPRASWPSRPTPPAPRRSRRTPSCTRPRGRPRDRRSPRACWPTAAARGARPTEATSPQRCATASGSADAVALGRRRHPARLMRG